MEGLIPSLSFWRGFKKMTTGIKIIDDKGNPLGIEVNPLKQVEESRTSAPIDFVFAKSGGVPTVLASATAIDDTSIDVVSATGFTAGTVIAVASGDRFYHGHIVSVVSNTLHMDTPLDYAFAGGSVVLNFTEDMNVDGSSSAQTFVVQSSALGELSFMITRIIFQITCDGEPDYIEFGNIAALAKGVIVRVANGETRNLFNIKSNEDLNLYAYDLSFLDGVKHGTFGVTARLTFGSLGKHGTAIKITPGEAMEVIIQDDLTDLTNFRMVAEGYVIE